MLIQLLLKPLLKKMHIKLIGPELTCENCAKSKAKGKRLNKESKALPAKSLGERVHFDLCTMRHTAYAGIKNWLLIQDEYTKFFWSRFMKLKSDLPQTMIDWLTGEEKKGSMVVSSFNIALTFPNNVAYFRSTLPLCSGVFGAVNSNFLCVLTSAFTFV